METYLTVEETAQTLKVSIDSVRRWLRTGKMKGSRYGRVWRVPASELRRSGRFAGMDPEVPVVATPRPANDETPMVQMMRFLHLADELSPLIAKGQKQPITSANISEVIADTRNERDTELHA